MKQTIFTGHTLCLDSIVAIGPIFIEVKRTIVEPCLSMMIIEIYLSSGSVISHVHFKSKAADFDEKKWTEKHDELMKLRAELVALWERPYEREQFHRKYTTSEARQEYQKSHLNQDPVSPLVFDKNG